MSIHQKHLELMQITYNSYAKYDLALYFTLIDSRLAELEPESAE